MRGCFLVCVVLRCVMKGGGALAGGLEENRTVKVLDLESNHIGSAAAQSFADALTRNNTLLELCLSNNHIGDAGARAICSMLVVNVTIESIMLGGNGFGDKLKEEIADNIKARRLAQEDMRLHRDKELQDELAEKADAIRRANADKHQKLETIKQQLASTRTVSRQSTHPSPFLPVINEPTTPTDSSYPNTPSPRQHTSNASPVREDALEHNEMREHDTTPAPNITNAVPMRFSSPVISRRNDVCGTYRMKYLH